MIPNKATIVMEEEDEIMDEIDDSDLDAFIPKEVVQGEGEDVVAKEEDTDDKAEESGDSEDEEVDENNSEEIEVEDEEDNGDELRR